MSNALVVNTPNRPVPIVIVGGGGGGGGIVAGADTQVQFNDAGAFGGDTGLTYNKNTDALKVVGPVVLGTLGDAAVARSAAGVVEINNGTVGQYRDLRVRNMMVQAGGRMTGAGAVPPAGTTGQHLIKNTNTDYDVSWATGTTKVSWLTTSGTYTTPANCQALMVQCVGGGGGGGGAAGVVSQEAVAGGGGGGGSATKYITGPAASYTYLIGAGGTGGVAGTNSGTAGGTTSFGGTPVCQAPGGNGGGGGTSGTAVQISGSPGLALTTGFVGDFTQLGGDGGYGLRLSSNAAAPSFGGSSAWSGQTAGANSNGAAGRSASGVGAGGAGAATNSATATAGGDGFRGAIMVIEFY